MAMGPWLSLLAWERYTWRGNTVKGLHVHPRKGLGIPPLCNLEGEVGLE
jgi:hypothetical protein